MDIQKNEAFEAHFKSTQIYCRECAIRGKDILEFSKTMGGYFNIVANDAWNMWQAAKAQAVPEGFVLMPKCKSESFSEKLDDYLEDLWQSSDAFDDGFVSVDEINHDKIWSLVIEAQEQKG